MATFYLWGLLTNAGWHLEVLFPTVLLGIKKNKEIKRSTARTKKVNMAALHPFLGEEKRIREFYQSRGLDRVSQPSGEGMSLVLIWGKGPSKALRASLLSGFTLWGEGGMEPVPASSIFTFPQSQP